MPFLCFSCVHTPTYLSLLSMDMAQMFLHRRSRFRVACWMESHSASVAQASQSCRRTSHRLSTEATPVLCFSMSLWSSCREGDVLYSNTCLPTGETAAVFTDSEMVRQNLDKYFISLNAWSFFNFLYEILQAQKYEKMSLEIFGLWEPCQNINWTNKTTSIVQSKMSFFSDWNTNLAPVFTSQIYHFHSNP